MRLTQRQASNDPARRVGAARPRSAMRARLLAAFGRGHACEGNVSTRKRLKDALADKSGASAVEFALVSLPFLLLCIGILQFVFLHYTQQTLTNALYNSASSPEADLISGNKTGYIATICAKVTFTTECLNSTRGLKVELTPLASLATTTTAISGSAALNPGASGDVLVLRASMQAPQIISFIPVLMAKDSVIFRRP